MIRFRKHIDDFFREKLGNYKETPPPDVWEALEPRLDGLKTLPATGPNRWIWHFAIVSLIVLLSVPFIRKMIGASLTEAPTKALAANTLTGPSTGETASKNTAATGVSTPATINENNIAAQKGPSDNTSGNQSGKVLPATGNRTSAGQANNDPAKKPLTRNSHTSGVKSAAGHAGPMIAEKTANNNTNSYNGSMANPSGEAATGSNSTEKETAAVNPNSSADNKQALPGTFKKEDKKESKPGDKNNTGTDASTPSPIGFKRFEAGIKAGYEFGLNSDAATKYVVAPYMQYNITSKISVMTQPAVKYATVADRSVGKPQSYYKTNSGTSTAVGDTVVNMVGEGSSTYPQYTTTYNYHQTHDSIVKSYTYGGTYLEFEVPVLMKYYVTPGFAVYGGGNILYNAKMPTLTEHTYTQQAIPDNANNITNTTNYAPAPLPLSEVFTNPGTPYQSYSPLTPSKQESQLRVGYMLGFSYEYSKKWLFDALLQQSPAKPDVKGGYNLNIPVSAPYFRLSVGYKLTK